MARLSNSIWWFRLGINYDSGNVINGKKFYATEEGCLIIHPDGKTIQFIKNTFFEDELKEANG